MKKKIVYEPNPSGNDILVALSYFTNYVKLLNKSNKPYESIVDWLLTKGFRIEEENDRLPSLKELGEELKISSPKIRKLLKMIYDDIFELNDSNPQLFVGEGQIHCVLSFEYLGCRASFDCGLNVIPRVGEYFSFFFIKSKVGGDGFNVDRIYHDVTSSGHTIFISLSTKQRNKYFELVKDKAYLKGFISFMDYIDGENDEKLKKELIGVNTTL